MDDEHEAIGAADGKPLAAEHERRANEKAPFCGAF